MTPPNEISLQSYLPASWIDKPGNVHAFTSLRTGGASVGSYSEFNLATHVGDELSTVIANRKKLSEDLQLPAEPVWLDQVHSNKVICLDKAGNKQPVPQADASISRTKDVVCAVLTADCLPVFFCNINGTEVAVAHAGWRGLHAGIISNTVNDMQSPSEEIMVSLGPAIGPQSFEVGTEVYDAFVDKNPKNRSAFVSTDKNHYLCDIYQLARIELSAIGVAGISGGESCTFKESDRYYSYRRQENTGRMASLIWFK